MADILKRTLERDTVDWGGSFINNGGDSLALVYFIAEVANTVGVDLSAEEVLKATSLNELGLLIAARGGETPPAGYLQYLEAAADLSAHLTPRQTIVCGDVPLTANRFSYFKRRGRDFEYWNLSPATLRVSFGFSDRALRRSVEHLVSHHDGLRLQLSGEEGRLAQHIGELDELSHLIHVNFRGHSDDIAWKGFVESAIAETFGSFTFPGALFKVLLVTADCGDGAVVCLVAHHITMDGYCVGVVLRDLDLLYHQASHDHEMLLPPKTTSYIDYARCSTEYWLSREDVLSFWGALLWEQVRDVPTEFPYAPEKNVERYSIRCIESLPALSRFEFLGQSADVNYNFLPVLLAAISKAYGDWTKHDVMLIANLFHGRESFLPGVDLSRTVGYICDFVPFVLPADQPVEQIHRSAQQQVTHARVAGKSYGVNRYLSTDPARRSKFGRHPEPQISLNVLPPRAGYPGASSLGTVTDEFRYPPDTKETTQRAFLLSGGVYFNDGRFCIAWDFSEQLFSKRSVQRFTQLCMEHFLSLREQVINGSQGQPPTNQLPDEGGRES